MRRLALLLFVAACSPVEPPIVEASPLADTADVRGPYEVTAKVQARRALDRVELVFHNLAAGAASVRVPMQQGAGLWTGNIPGHGRGARIAFHVEAVDSSGDLGVAPPRSDIEGGCGVELCFSVVPPP